MATDGRMIVDELEITWKEAVVANFKILAPQLPGDTERRNNNAIR
jgi:hypothetical protein